MERENWLAKIPFYKHVGMYAYRPEILKAVTSIPQGILEQAEFWSNYGGWRTVTRLLLASRILNR